MAILTGNVAFDVIALTVTIIVGIIAFFKYKYTYWEKRGLVTLEPTIPFGNVKKLILGQQNFSDFFKETYDQVKAKGLKHAGYYLIWKPAYVVTDLDILKRILQTDFQHFMNHGGFTSDKHDPLNGHLFNLSDSRWRNMRVKLTPTFTSGKMKMMFQTMIDCSLGMQEIVENAASVKEPVEIKEVLSRFTTDVIGSVAFGIECNSFKDPNSEFAKYGKRINDMTPWERVKVMLMVSLPQSFLELIRYKFTKPDVEAFFMDVVKKTVEYREKNNIYRKDFMHLLLQLKNRGLVADDDKITGEDVQTEQTITLNELAAQCYLFFSAGYDTASTTITFALLELAQNQEMQDRLRQEIRKVLEKNGGQITYNGVVQEMTYLDQIMSETLRKYPPLPFLPRECTKPYNIPGTSVTIEKGTAVLISVIGIHYDPEYYPDPDKFDPERFSEENKNTRPALSWIPFGEGPRACIGLRFGLLESKLGIVAFLKDHRIKLNNKTKTPITISMEKVTISVDGGVWLDVERIN